MNPLSELCKQMGVSVEMASSLAETDVDLVRKVLAKDPPKSVRAYLAVADAIGVRYKIAPAPPMCVSFDLPYLDSLCYESSFRMSQGLEPWPLTRADIRNIAISLTARNPGQPTKVAALMEASMIPTPTGMRQWLRSSVDQYVRIERTRLMDLPPEKPDWIVSAWRDWIRSKLADLWCASDPASFVRHGFMFSEEGDRLIARSGPLPMKAKEWILKSLGSVEWLTGRWVLE